MENFRKDDIVELMNYTVRPGSEGLHENHFGLIPKVGDRFRVLQVNRESCSLNSPVRVTVQVPKGTLIFDSSQVFVYQAAEKVYRKLDLTEQWIPVMERLPGGHELCNVVLESGAITCGRTNHSSTHWIVLTVNGYKPHIVTHWAPLPPAPEYAASPQ